MKKKLIEEAYKHFPEAENDLQAVEKYRNIVFYIARKVGKNDENFDFYRNLYYELNELYEELFHNYLNEEIGGQNVTK